MVIIALLNKRTFMLCGDFFCSLLQRAACGTLTGASETTTEGKQKDRLRFIANLVDATIKTRVLNDTRASELLMNTLLRNQLVHAATFTSHCDTV